MINVSSWDEWKCDFMGIFRDPIARGWSSFDYFIKGIGKPAGGHPAPNMTALQHATCIAGSAVKQITGQQESIDNEYGTLPTCVEDRSGEKIVPDVAKAISRLDGFKFVGLTSDWDRSICLFHAKLGGECRAVEFLDSRPTGGNSSYPKTPLGGLRDEYDEALYSAVLDKYRKDLHAYGIHEALCRRVCPVMASKWPDGTWSPITQLA